MSLTQDERRYSFTGTFGRVKKSEKVQSHIDEDEFQRFLDGVSSGPATEDAK